MIHAADAAATARRLGTGYGCAAVTEWVAGVPGTVIWFGVFSIVPAGEVRHACAFDGLGQDAREGDPPCP
jgi:hypothetical protein